MEDKCGNCNVSSYLSWSSTCIVACKIFVNSGNRFIMPICSHWFRNCKVPPNFILPFQIFWLPSPSLILRAMNQGCTTFSTQGAKKRKRWCRGPNQRMNIKTRYKRENTFFFVIIHMNYIYYYFLFIHKLCNKQIK